MQRHNRHTKIVATVGPSSESPEMLRALMEAGADVFRLNFSHGDHEGKTDMIRRIREISAERRWAVAILADLQGPKIRAGKMESGAVSLKDGDEVVITTEEVLGTSALFSTVYQHLPQDVVPGDCILLDDGLIELKVLSSDEKSVRCKIVVGGMLKDRKGINLPGVQVSVPALTEKDIEDLEFCLNQEIDYIALSFVRSADDVIQLKERLYKAGSQMQVIAKIEKPEAVDNFDAILEVSDGIMVARGDLGVEVQPEKVPLIQKQIIRKCNAVGKPVITATQMLESMIGNPRPTRAETSDVANAILDGTDAIMLSGETAAGKYPVEAVKLMVRVALDVEGDPVLKEQVFHPIPEVRGCQQLSEAIGQAACRVAEQLGCAAILAFTQTGTTAILVAKYRPRVTIFAVTPSQQVRRRMVLYRGVYSIRVPIAGDTESQIRSVEEAVLSGDMLNTGDTVVITMGSPVSDPGTTNLMKVHRLGTGKFFEVY